MGNGIIGKILYFWVFLIGALIFARIFHIFTSDKSMIIFCIAVAIIYIVWNVFREMGKRKREAKASAEFVPAKVHKGNKKKRR